MTASSAVLAGRVAAEREMDDTCRIVAPGAASSWDEANGVWTTTEGALLYDGKCRVRQPAAGRQAEAGESAFNISDRIVSIPFGGVPIPVGAQVLMTSSALDPSMVGKRLTYLSPASEQTHSTARRMLCRSVD